MAEFANEQEHLSGLARDIRTAVSSEQLDLGNYTEQRAKDLVNAAFSTPLTAPNEMVKFTFIVGGGKLVRSRYSDDLTRWMVSALRDIGYTEDRSAAETFDSQGTFKQQHDTGQNLKYLIVYPHVACANKKTTASSTSQVETVQDTKSPEYLLTAAEFATFQEMVNSKIVTYKQKKRVLKLLQDDLEAYKIVEEKLISGAQLTPKEQAFYDSNTSANAEKITYLQNEIKTMVDGGQLTQSEKEELLSHLDANSATVEAEINEAKVENKLKKVEKLEEKKKNIAARKAVVSAVIPIKHRLKFGDEIQKLRLRLFPLLALEERGRSCSLTLADLKVLEEKSEVEEAIKGYETASRGWFEDEADWLEKCHAEEKQAKVRYNERVKKNASGGGGGGKTGTQNKIHSVNSSRTSSSVGSSSVGGWSTNATKKINTTQSTTVKKPTSGVSGFAAAFAGSDSD